MTEMERTETVIQPMSPSYVHKKWTRSALIGSGLAITGLVSTITYAATLYSGYLNIPIEELSKISPTTESAIHAKMLLPVITSVVGYATTIFTTITTAVLTLDE